VDKNTLLENFVIRTTVFRLPKTVLVAGRHLPLYEVAAWYPDSLPIPLYYYRHYVQAIAKAHWLENRDRARDNAYREEVQQLLERAFSEARIRDELRAFHAPARKAISYSVTLTDNAQFIEVEIFTPDIKGARRTYSVTQPGRRAIAPDVRDNFQALIARRLRQANDDPAEFYRD
jgi:hypothetical protein